jgi:hypothetical protein
MFYRQIVSHGITNCEMSGEPLGFGWAVHHPLGRGVVVRWDIRNGICLSADAHQKYDHNLPLLVTDMRAKHILLDQANWLERHAHDLNPQASAWIDFQEEHERLRAMWQAVQRGEKTREDFRDWTD